MILHPIPASAIWRAGHSTKWPGRTRFAFISLVFAAVLALAEFGLGVYIAYHMLAVPRDFKCWVGEGIGVVRMDRPLTVRYEEESGSGYAFSVAANGHSFTIVSAAAVLPGLAFLILLGNLGDHWSRIANIQALVNGCIGLGIWALILVSDQFFKIDDGYVKMDYPVCYTTQKWRPWTERWKRTRLIQGRERMILVIELLFAIYITFALYAAYLNKKDIDSHEARTQAFELLDLPPTSRRFERPRRYSNPVTESERQCSRSHLMGSYPWGPPSSVAVGPRSSSSMDRIMGHTPFQQVDTASTLNWPEEDTEDMDQFKDMRVFSMGETEAKEE